MPWILRRKLIFELEGRALAPCHFFHSDACSVKVAACPRNQLPGDRNESRNRSTKWLVSCPRNQLPGDRNESRNRSTKWLVSCPGFEPAGIKGPNQPLIGTAFGGRICKVCRYARPAWKLLHPDVTANNRMGWVAAGTQLWYTGPPAWCPKPRKS